MRAELHIPDGCTVAAYLVHTTRRVHTDEAQASPQGTLREPDAPVDHDTSSAQRQGGLLPSLLRAVQLWGALPRSARAPLADHAAALQRHTRRAQWTMLQLDLEDQVPDHLLADAVRHGRRAQRDWLQWCAPYARAELRRAPELYWRRTPLPSTAARAAARACTKALRTRFRQYRRVDPRATVRHPRAYHVSGERRQRNRGWPLRPAELADDPICDANGTDVGRGRGRALQIPDDPSKTAGPPAEASAPSAAAYVCCSPLWP